MGGEQVSEVRLKTSPEYMKGNYFIMPNEIFTFSLSPNAISVYTYLMLYRVLKRAGLPAVRFHDLRHTFATLTLQNGVDIKTVSGMPGHFSVDFTLDTYAHVTTAAQKEAANTMGSVLSA